MIIFLNVPNKGVFEMIKSKLKSLIALSAISLLTMATVLPTSASAAWKQDSNGWWNTEGDSYSTGWRSINGAWYYFNTDGYMKTGWLNDNGTWYYLNDSGSMNNGWVNSNGSWYYLDPSSGAMKTGWANNNGTWYYLDPSSGAMKTGLVQVDNKTYYLNNSGAMQTGNITINGQSYTFATSGEKLTTTASSTNSTSSTATDTTTTSSDSSSNSGSSRSSSGGSSGGSSSSSSSNSSSSNSSYSNVFGTWKVEKRLDSNATSQLSALKISLAIGENVTISSSKIHTSIGNVNNPKFSSKTLTASAFAASYPDTFASLGIDADKIQCVTVSGSFDGSNGSGSLLVIDNNTLYVYAKGTLFELDRVS
ncbi:autolysin [Clostridium saccharobutylicum]|nr:autolysin [Clostridium saccharobutylicum]